MPAIEKKYSSIQQGILILIAMTGLLLVYLFQQFDIVYWITQNREHPNLHFIINRGVRLLLNDIFMLLFIAVWFQDRSIARLALIIQLIDFFLLLPLYLFVKLTLEGDAEIS